MKSWAGGEPRRATRQSIQYLPQHRGDSCAGRLGDRERGTPTKSDQPKEQVEEIVQVQYELEHKLEQQLEIQAQLDSQSNPTEPNNQYRQVAREILEQNLDIA